MYCKHCGKKVADNAKFCDGCGEKIDSYSEQEHTTAKSPKYGCSECGAPIEPGQRQCGACGALIDGKSGYGRRMCAKCKSYNIKYQTVSESVPTGCFTVILYILLSLTILGLLIVVPLMLRKKTEAVTYAVCQDCGHKWRIE